MGSVLSSYQRGGNAPPEVGIEWPERSMDMKRIKLGFLIIAAVILLGAVSPIWAGAEEYADLHEGVDVSLYQGDINFSSVRADGRTVVYIKAGQDDYEDPFFRRNAALARQAGMNVGFYFFVTAENVSEAQEQARYFASIIRPFYYDCRPAVDFEQYGDLSVSELNRIALAFSKTLTAETGVVPLFYTNTYSAENVWSDSLTAYPLWIAEYGVSRPETGVWDGWAGHQYVDNGLVSGISTPVDLDVFTDGVFLSEAEHLAAHGYPKPDPAEPETFDYTVVWGDTLWDLALCYGTTVDELVSLNHIDDPNLIIVGQILKIPVMG